MNRNNSIGLSPSEYKRLLKTPESELLGEIIRLNNTIYANTLDVIKVCSTIRSCKSATAGKAVLKAFKKR